MRMSMSPNPAKKQRTPLKRLRRFLLKPLRRDFDALGQGLDRLDAEIGVLRRMLAEAPQAVHAAPPEALPAEAAAGAPEPDINMLLHQGRTALLRRLPPCRTLVSAGCAGLWYFEWVEQAFGHVERHLGVEYYMPKPEGLPANVTWITNTCSDMSSIGDASADLVFSGQNVEHLWPEEVVGFLTESARIMEKGGLLVVDSPNRTITEALGWSQPEHTVELTVEEAAQLIQHAGFDIEAVRGVWLTRDPKSGRLLPFVPTGDEPFSVVERSMLATDLPEQSFIWWIEARRNAAAPDEAWLRRRMQAIFDEAWPQRIRRSMNHIGRRIDIDGSPWIDCAATEAGAALFGPYMPFRAGRYRVTFHFDVPPGSHPRVHLDVVARDAELVLASRKVKLPTGRSTETFDFALDDLAFGGQFRCLATASGPFKVRAYVDLEATNQAAAA